MKNKTRQIIKTIRPLSIFIGILLCLCLVKLSYAAEPPVVELTEKDALAMAKYMDTLLAAESSLIKSIEDSGNEKAKAILRTAKEKRLEADKDMGQKKYNDAYIKLQASYNHLMEGVKAATARSREEKILMDDMEESKVAADMYITAAEKAAKGTKNTEALKLVQDAVAARAKADEDVKNRDFKEALKNMEASISYARRVVILLKGGEHIREESIKEKEKKDVERKEVRYKDAIERKAIEVDTLISAAERLTTKEENEEAKELLKSALEKKQIGLNYADKNDYESAIKNLKESYYLAARSIKKMRQGKVVVHAVTFESVRDEFIYEKDRNETHRSLLTSIITSKGDNNNIEIQKLIEEANAMKNKAHEDASHEKYTEALKNIGISTHLIIKALKILGFEP